MGFTTPSYSLTDLFDRIDRSELQIPDFQHEFSWDIDRIRSLIASILRGYPVGALLALDVRNTDTPIKYRPIHGAPDNGVAPGLLLLDGQQRVTAMYHSLHRDGLVHTVDFLGNKIRRRFYVDVRLAVAHDSLTDEAVFSVDETGMVRSHFGPDAPNGIVSREDMLEHYVIPVSWLFGEEGNDLLFDMATSTEDSALREEVKLFHNRVLRTLTAYDIPMIRLDRDTSRSGVGRIFAHANSIGQPMDVFELLTAVFAKGDSNFRLADHWAKVEEGLRKHPALDGIGRIRFLRAVSLLATSRKGSATGHRGDILNLSLDEYLHAADDLVRAFDTTAQFLAERRILGVDQVPYDGQIVPLAVIMARLNEQPGALDSQQSRDRLNQWFWSGVFGELYGAAAPTIRAARDVDQVTPWVLGQTDSTPKTINDASFKESRLFTANESSGVYRGLYALLMARGARDWRTGETFTPDNVADLQPGFYQVFPEMYCQAAGIDAALATSVLNRAPMGKRTEVVIDGGEPKRYLRRIQSKSIMEDDEFDAVLSTHELEPEYLFRSQWREFFEDRRRRLVGMIEYAMDKKVIKDLDHDEDAARDHEPADGDAETSD